MLSSILSDLRFLYIVIHSWHCSNRFDTAMNCMNHKATDECASDWTELIRSAQTGNQEALAALMTVSRQVVREHAAHSFPASLQSRMDSSDVVQEVLLKARLKRI